MNKRLCTPTFLAAATVRAQSVTDATRGFGGPVDPTMNPEASKSIPDVRAALNFSVKFDRLLRYKIS
jgi:hypothetical protein